MPKLRTIDRSRDYLKEHPVRTDARKTTQKPLFGDDFLNEYYHGGLGRDNLQTIAASGEDINFETEEIKVTLYDIEYKINETNASIRECFQAAFKRDSMASPEEVKLDCAGASYQILIMNYKEGMKRTKDVLIELIKAKLPVKAPKFDEEIRFFIDLIEQIVDNDFKIDKTLKIAKQAAKYYVSPRILDQIITFAEEEIYAFEEIQEKLKAARREVQTELEKHILKEDGLIRKLRATDNENTRRWKKAEIFRKLEQGNLNNDFFKGARHLWDEGLVVKSPILPN